IPEDSSPETAVALFSVRDRDSGDNGRTVCSIQDNVPFALKSTLKNYYELVTQKPLDREKVPEYNISITATDRGTPRLTSVRIIRVQLSDINDNPPVFNESSYVMYLKENNHPGLLIGTVHAADLDTEQNAKVTYSALLGNIGDLPFSSSISINSENGNVYALQSLDYEQTRDFQVTVRAADGGSPPLSSEVIVRVVIIDENNNAPFILYPLQNSSSPANDLVPRSAEAGYLVTKVVAVDGDSGQNSWLSYQLLKATDPGLFAVGLQTGEVKTSRPITSPDSVKQKLIVLVRDNGEPPRSTTSTLNVLLVDGFSDAYMQLLDVPQEEEEQDTLTLYLVISLSFISFLFLVSVVTIIAIRLYKTRQCRERYVPSSRNFYCEPNFPTNPADRSVTGTLPQSYCYEVCLTTGSGTSEFKFLRPLVPSLPADPSAADGSILDSQINSQLKKEKESLREIQTNTAATLKHNVMRSVPSQEEAALKKMKGTCPNMQDLQLKSENERLRASLSQEQRIAADRFQQQMGSLNARLKEQTKVIRLQEKTQVDEKEIAYLKKLHWCKEKKYDYHNLPKTSVVIAFYNEAWSTLLRTVHSVLETSPDILLEEVILVDDYSDKDHLKKPLENYVAGLRKVRLIRANKREGLVRARLLGASLAKGDVLTFLDCHCECHEGWLEPLLERSPTMAGGLFAVSKKYFDYLGSYDTGMEVWGGENLEFSFRIWQCGGSLEIHPCSHVGHVFPKQAPYSRAKALANSVRAAEVWMDEYKELYYHRNPHARMEPYGDVTERRLLREKLKCKDFKWFLENIYPELHVPEDRPGFFGMLQNRGMANYCFDYNPPNEHEVTGHRIILYPCHGMGQNQFFEYTSHNEIRYNTRQPEACAAVDSETDYLTMYLCQDSVQNIPENQKFVFREDGTLFHVQTQKCLQAESNSYNGNPAPLLRPCSNSEYQKWFFKERS
ncbi:Polypeptide N-acetylgalactosaminyltransferase 12, partial [Chelonia mydas]